MLQRGHSWAEEQGWLPQPARGMSDPLLHALHHLQELCKKAAPSDPAVPDTQPKGAEQAAGSGLPLTIEVNAAIIVLV